MEIKLNAVAQLTFDILTAHKIKFQVTRPGCLTKWEIGEFKGLSTHDAYMYARGVERGASEPL